MIKFILVIALILGALGFYAYDDELLDVADITCKVEKTVVGYPIRSCSIEVKDKGFIGKLLD